MYLSYFFTERAHKHISHHLSHHISFDKFHGTVLDPNFVAMAPGNGRIVVAPGAPQHILDLCRASALQSPKTKAFSQVARSRNKWLEKSDLPKGKGQSKPPRPHTEPTVRKLLRSNSRESIGTLFSGERVGSAHLMRGSGVIFRRPRRSRVPPHQRPIFLVSDNGTDARDSLDIHDPKRFSSVERTFALRGIRHLNPLLPGSRPCSVASASSCSSPIPDAAIAAFRPVSQGLASG